jgi:hypothetical protein
MTDQIIMSNLSQPPCLASAGGRAGICLLSEMMGHKNQAYPRTGLGIIEF